MSKRLDCGCVVDGYVLAPCVMHQKRTISSDCKRTETQGEEMSIPKPKHAIMKITPELLHSLLRLPHDIRVVGARSDDRAPWEPIDVWIESDRYPELDDGATPPVITPIYTTMRQTIVVVDGSFNLPKDNNRLGLTHIGLRDRWALKR